MQNPFSAGVILGIVGLLFGIVSGGPLVFGALGFLLGHTWVTHKKVNTLQLELEQLRALLTSDQSAPDQPAAQQRASSVPPAKPEATPEAQASAPPSKPETQTPPPAADPIPAAASSAVRSAGPVSSSQAQARPPRAPRPPSALSNLLTASFKWFTGGNLFMKVGIALLFLGVGFLLNYAASQGVFTLEMRLVAIAVAGIAALIIGQRLISRRREYALMLQGAAIGVLYLDIFGAYSLYALIPPTLTFGILAAISALSAALAVMHKAPSLAFVGFAGGFLAPILASSGSGNHVGLFSYYMVLNAAILGVAWFRSWRALNLLGFYLTFGVGALWGVDAYHPDKYASTQPFLVVFFLFYVAISVLYARRQAPALKGVVDASLLFGTPVLAFTMQLVLMQPFEYGSAWSAFALGSFYIGLTALLWRQKRAGEQLLVEVFLALGVLFTTLVIPFALGASDTAGAWALEGAGMVWIGLRQNRALARALGILLQMAAAGFWLTHVPAQEQQMFINSSYLAGIMIALASFFSARLYRQSPSRWEKPLGALFVGSFVAWWYGVGYREIGAFSPEENYSNWVVGFTAVSALVVFELGKHWNWSLMRNTSLLAPLPFAVAAAYLLFIGELPHANLGWLFWPLGLLSYGWILLRSEEAAPAFILGACHALWAFLTLGLIQWETMWVAEEILSLEGSWFVAMAALPPILALYLIHRSSVWPIVDWAKTYTGVVSTGVIAVLALYLLASVELSGDAKPLPWVPLLNPLDLVTLVAMFAIYTALMDIGRLFPALNQGQIKRMGVGALGASVFVWLNVTLFRSLHHWKGLPYDLDQLLQFSYAQTSLSILWVTLGMLLVVTATRLATRTLWITGAVLLGAVVLKLFVQDLANTGSLARIVSFLGVGGMLVVIGYFSPLPPKKKAGHGAPDPTSNSTPGTPEEPVSGAKL